MQGTVSCVEWVGETERFVCKMSVCEQSVSAYVVQACLNDNPQIRKMTVLLENTYLDMLFVSSELLPV